MFREGLVGGAAVAESRDWHEPGGEGIVSAMTPSTQRRVEKRWHELLVKEADGSITPPERAKLARYQALRRPRLTPTEVRRHAEQDWRYRQLWKELGDGRRPGATGNRPS